MNFNLFGKKKYLKTLKENGGILNVYSNLIKEIKGVSETYDTKYKVITQEIKEDTFAIIIDFSNMKDMMIAYSDTFVLIEKQKHLKIDWKRHSQSKLPMMSSPLPEKINKSFLFDKDTDQDKIFKSLIENINNVLKQKYNFSDMHYELIQESGNSKYISKEEMRKMEREMYK